MGLCLLICSRLFGQKLLSRGDNKPCYIDSSENVEIPCQPQRRNAMPTSASRGHSQVESDGNIRQDGICRLTLLALVRLPAGRLLVPEDSSRDRVWLVPTPVQTAKKNPQPYLDGGDDPLRIYHIFVRFPQASLNPT